MNLYENADQEKFIEATSAGISDLDTQVMAENVNAALRIINSIHEEKPELFTTLLRGFADSVDEEELQKTVQWMVPEVLGTFRSLASAAIPALMDEFCEMVRQNQNEKFQKAFKNLRSVILADGGVK